MKKCVRSERKIEDIKTVKDYLVEQNGNVHMLLYTCTGLSNYESGADTKYMQEINQVLDIIQNEGYTIKNVSLVTELESNKYETIILYK